MIHEVEGLRPSLEYGTAPGSLNRLISGSGGNFANLVDKPFIGRVPCCNLLTIDMLHAKQK